MNSDWAFAALITALLSCVFLSGTRAWEFVDVNLETVYLNSDGSVEGREAGLPDWDTPHPTYSIETDDKLTVYINTNTTDKDCNNFFRTRLKFHKYDIY